MAPSIFLPAPATEALDPDVIAAWAGTDRPTMQALLAAGLPIPIEETGDDADLNALVTRYQHAGLMVEVFSGAQAPLEWLKATAILLLTAGLFRVVSKDSPALMDLSTIPFMAGAYTLILAAVLWAWRRRRAAALKLALDTADRHLMTAAPVGPCAVQIGRIRSLRREVVAAALPVATQGELLSMLFDLEISQNTIGTLPLDVTDAIAEVTRRLKAATEQASA